MTKEIPLTQGQVALVDASDYEYLSQWKWRAHYDPTILGFYAVRTRYHGAKTRVAMHRELCQTELQPGLVVDHISGVTLDNRRANLRVATPQQNARNRRPRNYTALGIKGVIAHRGRYRARITNDSKRLHLGCYDTIAEAAAAYQRAAQELFGEFARTA